jgi:uncharacterized membrane protein YfcA
VIAAGFAESLSLLASNGALQGCLGPEVEFSLVGAALIGLAVGFLSGLLGVGGGFLLAPLVNGLLQVPFRVTGPSNLCQIQGTSLSGLLRHRRQGNVDVKVALIVLVGTLCGTFAGVNIMEHLKTLGSVNLAGGQYTTVEVVLSFLFLAMLAVIGGTVLVEAVATGRRLTRTEDPKEATRRGLFAGVRIPPYVTPIGGEPVPMLLVAGAGVVVGMLQSLLGISGVLLLPVLVYFVGVSTHAAVGTNLMVVFATSLLGTTLHALAGNISLPLVFMLLAGGTLGSQFGALLSPRIAGHKLRKYFALLVVAAMVMVAGKLAYMYGLISWWPGR